MKVAVCLSGQVRFLNEGYASLRECILEKNDCDIFLQTYEGPTADAAISLYRPKEALIDKPIPDFEIPSVAEGNKYDETNIPNLYWMWRNVKKSIELVPEGYDVVIRARYDLKYPGPMSLEGIDTNYIYVPDGGDHRGGLFDMFAISSRPNMQYYGALFDRMNYYIENVIMAHSETLLRHHLIAARTRVAQVMRFAYPMFVFRPGENGVDHHLATVPTVDNPLTIRS